MFTCFPCSGGPISDVESGVLLAESLGVGALALATLTGTGRRATGRRVLLAGAVLVLDEVLLLGRDVVQRLVQTLHAAVLVDRDVVALTHEFHHVARVVP